MTANIATYEALSEYWTMDDVMRATAVLDIKEDIQAASMPKSPDPGKA